MGLDREITGRRRSGDKDLLAFFLGFAGTGLVTFWVLFVDMLNGIMKMPQSLFKYLFASCVVGIVVAVVLRGRWVKYLPLIAIPPAGLLALAALAFAESVSSGTWRTLLTGEMLWMLPIVTTIALPPILIPLLAGRLKAEPNRMGNWPGS